MAPGQALVLTKPLGTGTILAAHMQVRECWMGVTTWVPGCMPAVGLCSWVECPAESETEGGWPYPLAAGRRQGAVGGGRSGQHGAVQR